MTTKRDDAIRLRAEHLTYREIGSRLGVSTERARQLVKVTPSKPKPDLQSKVMLRTNEVAFLLGVHANTVRRWSDTGLLKPYRISLRGDRRFKRADVEELLKDASDALR